MKSEITIDNQKTTLSLASENEFEENFIKNFPFTQTAVSFSKHRENNYSLRLYANFEKLQAPPV
ncbi:MAG TPA: hypothetical protein PL045_13865, partial [Chitinophagaceae bacterium]|nr:hypothetical protein [Chitinophagaceae bacterium]